MSEKRNRNQNFSFFFPSTCNIKFNLKQKFKIILRRRRGQCSAAVCRIVYGLWCTKLLIVHIFLMPQKRCVRISYHLFLYIFTSVPIRKQENCVRAHIIICVLYYIKFCPIIIILYFACLVYIFYSHTWSIYYPPNICLERCIERPFVGYIWERKKNDTSYTLLTFNVCVFKLDIVCNNM